MIDYDDLESFDDLESILESALNDENEADSMFDDDTIDNLKEE